MSKTIAQLNEVASLIKEATLKGENTADRVGGLFVDIVDYLGTIGSNEVVLSPLLEALNNSSLLDPSDGNTLAFSVLKDGWTFSDAIAQLKITTKSIETTVASNYEAFSNMVSVLEADVAETDARVRSYKTDYDNSQLEYATWKTQTDTSISQYAVALTVDGEIVSMSSIVQTCYDITETVTNNKDAADTALTKLFNLTGLDYEDTEEEYTASWLYQNRQGIYGAAATFDEEGNILSSSTLQVTIDGIETSVSDMDGKVSSISQTVDAIELLVETINGNYSSIKQTVDNISLEVYDTETGIAALNVKSNSISEQITSINGTMASMELSIEKRVTYDELGQEIEEEFSQFEVSANKIVFTDFTETWTVANDDGDIIFKLSKSGVEIRGTLYADSIFHTDSVISLSSGDSFSMAENNPDIQIFTFNGSGSATVYLPRASYFEDAVINIYIHGATSSSTDFSVIIKPNSYDGSNLYSYVDCGSKSSITATKGQRLEFYCTNGVWYLLSQTS